MAHNVVFNSIREVDMTRLCYPQFAVYSNLEKHPGKAVVKILDDGKETNMMIIQDNLGNLCREIQNELSREWYWREKDDEPELVGMLI